MSMLQQSDGQSRYSLPHSVYRVLMACQSHDVKERVRLIRRCRIFDTFSSLQGSNLGVWLICRSPYTWKYTVVMWLCDVCRNVAPWQNLHLALLSQTTWTNGSSMTLTRKTSPNRYGHITPVIVIIISHHMIHPWGRPALDMAHWERILLEKNKYFSSVWFEHCALIQHGLSCLKCWTIE